MLMKRWLQRGKAFLFCFFGSSSCTSCFVIFKIILCLNPSSSLIEFVDSGMWIIGTPEV